VPPARIAFLAATVAGIAFTARAVLAVPPPLPVSIVCACVYFTLLAAGVVMLRLRMFADALVRGPADATGVALTYEATLDEARTRLVLDALDAAEAKATFFVLGVKAEEHRELALEIVKRGHTLGIQGFVRDFCFVLRGSKRVQGDLERAVRVIENITEAAPIFFRPPFGHTNPTMARIADRLDLTVIGWSASAPAGDALADGAIVRLRDVASVTSTLEKIAAKNLRVVPLGDWLET
jgi:peptidoglycan/xylan/chitin deacetylase (PgdA/CDA1 family)